MLDRSTVAATAAALLMAYASSARAAPSYTAIYSFGDSLSDVGNVHTLTTILTLGKTPEPAAPYVNGQFSNGSVWVQDLSELLGLAPLKPSLLGGTDYAWGGATTGYSGTLDTSTPVPTLTTQVDEFLQAHPKAPSSCFVPAFDGAFLSSESKDALWARFFTGAPQRQRRSVERYSIVKRA
jgi:phospholipase/lecithinase/hemolysin